jgi:hypothetical protein
VATAAPATATGRPGSSHDHWSSVRSPRAIPRSKHDLDQHLRHVLAEWGAHIAAHGKATPGEAKRDAAIADLKKRLTAKTQECALLEKKLKAAQTAIAALFHDNEAIRQQLAKDASITVTPFRPCGPR